MNTNTVPVRGKTRFVCKTEFKKKVRVFDYIAVESAKEGKDLELELEFDRNRIIKISNHNILKVGVLEPQIYHNKFNRKPGSRGYEYRCYAFPVDYTENNTDKTKSLF